MLISYLHGLNRPNFASPSQNADASPFFYLQVKVIQLISLLRHSPDFHFEDAGGEVQRKMLCGGCAQFGKSEQRGESEKHEKKKKKNSLGVMQH